MYTRAVDVARMSDLIQNDFRNDDDKKQEDYYNIADMTWQNLLLELIEWINDNGGQAIIGNTVVIKVDRNFLRQLLESSQTITELSFN